QRQSKAPLNVSPTGCPSLSPGKAMARAGPPSRECSAAALTQRIGTKMKFNSSDNRGGRPRGSRNKWFAQVFEDVLQHWNQPVEGRNISKGMAALEVMRKERP